MDKAALIKNAQKYLSKGQVDKAIAEWQKVAGAFPDGNTFNFLGDLYLKKGDKTSAVVEYHKAAKVYMSEGFSLKALAIFKKILNIDPHDTTALIALGNLNEEKNIFTDAIKYYLAAAAALSKQNKRDELLGVYERILNLAPKNLQLRIKVAELFSKEGFVPEAAREYGYIGQLYNEKGETKSAHSYLKKSVEIQPNNKDVWVELSVLSESAGDLKQAIKFMQTAIDKTGEDSALLIRTAALMIKQGAPKDASKLLGKVLEKDPDNTGARRQLAELYLRAGEKEKAWQEYSAISDSLLAEGKTEDVVKILNAFKDTDPITTRRKLVSIYRDVSDDSNAVNELTGLHEAYSERGMKEDATAAIKEALEIMPENGGLLAKLSAMEGGPAASFIEEGAMELEGMQFKEEVGTEFSGEIPSSKFEGTSYDFDEPVLSTPPIDEPADDSPGADQEKPMDEALTEADVFLKYGLFNDARNLLESLIAQHPDSLDLRLKLKTLYTATNEIEQAVTECLILSDIYKRNGDEAASQSCLNEAYALSPGDPRLEGKVAPQPEPFGAMQAEGAVAASVDYGAELSRADLFMEQGFFKEALDLYRDLLDKSPDKIEVKVRLQEAEQKLLEAHPAAAPGEEALAATAPAGETFHSFAGDTSLFDDFEIPEFKAFEGLETTEPALDDDIQEIFDEFKKGLSSQIEAEDAETHYNLGIAYKEMGLMEDAIKEFQTAQHDPDFFVTSCTMLGICYMQKGSHSESIDAFSAALMKTDPGNETAWSLKFDLALAYEKNGSIKQALQMFTEVYNWNAGFRGVSGKLNALKVALEGSAKDKKSRVSYI